MPALTTESLYAIITYLQDPDFAVGEEADPDGRKELLALVRPWGSNPAAVRRAARAYLVARPAWRKQYWDALRERAVANTSLLRRCGGAIDAEQPGAGIGFLARALIEETGDLDGLARSLDLKLLELGYR